MKCSLITASLFLIVLSGTSMAQSPTCPAGLVCLSQAAANVAAENARELAATKDLVVELKAAVRSKDITIEEIKATAKTNESELRTQLMKVTTDYGVAQGQVIELKNANAEKTQQINVLLNQTRKKCGVILSVCF